MRQPHPDCEKDPTATNVAQIVISGTRRSAPDAMSLPPFGSSYSDTEIAAVADQLLVGLAARLPSSRLAAACISATP